MATKKEPSFNVSSFIEGSEDNKNFTLQQEIIPVESTVPAPRSITGSCTSDIYVIHPR